MIHSNISCRFFIELDFNNKYLDDQKIVNIAETAIKS